ncbi:hypothetical protein SCALM49S_07857 [Streptomyces californicus]
MSLPLPLDGLSAIVTGAGRGLGRAEALELARLGAAVVVNDYGQPGRDGSGEASAAPAEEVAAEIRASGGRAVAHLGDVSDHEQARELVALAIEAHGTLDILVNNAGILRDRMVFSMTEEEWDAVVRVHLKGHFNTTHFAAAHWRARSKETGGPVHGRIVNTSSEAFLAGSAGQPNVRGGQGRNRRPHHLGERRHLGAGSSRLVEAARGTAYGSGPSSVHRSGYQDRSPAGRGQR